MLNGANNVFICKSYTLPYITGNLQIWAITQIFVVNIPIPMSLNRLPIFNLLPIEIHMMCLLYTVTYIIAGYRYVITKNFE